MSSELPAPPDFAALDRSAAKSADQRTRILALIGNLVFAWSNNESMFIYLTQILLRTDLPSASIVFVSLNTTRARLDLIRRLAKARLDDEAMIKKIDKMIDRFNACTRVRNEFNHCIYQLDEHGVITHTNVLRLRETKTSVEFAEVRAFDEKRIREITKTIKKLTLLNREIWSFLPELDAYLAQPKGRRGRQDKPAQPGQQ